MQVRIGVDIGGTKVKAGAVRGEADALDARLAASAQIDTPRLPPDPFYDQLAALIRGVQSQAEAAGATVCPVVAVAHPGRFLADGTLARGTTPNLGTAPNQFDGIAPARELERRLGVSVVAENDAVAQMRFGLALLVRDPAVRPRLTGQTVVYLGPGTGMGGGVAQVGADGQVTPVTDGHLFDLQVAGIGDGTLTAEELFTGPAIAQAVEEANRTLAVPVLPARAGQLDLLLQRCQTPFKAGKVSDTIRVAEQIADWQGEILAAIIQTVHEGRIRKARLERLPDGRVLRHVDEPDRAWRAADQRLVRGTARYVLGGFVGTSRGLGGRIRQRALERLAARGRSGIEIFQIPRDAADAGLLGAVHALPQVSDTFQSGKGV